MRIAVHNKCEKHYIGMIHVIDCRVVEVIERKPI